MANAFKYVKEVGIATERAYPYASGRTGIAGKCKQTPRVLWYSYMVGIMCPPNCDAVVAALKLRPLSVVVDATDWGPY